MKHSSRPTAAARKAKRADLSVTHKAAAARDHPLVKALAWLGEGADQPPLIIASIGTLAIGAATRRNDLMRSGARMLAAHLLATGGKTIVKHLVDRTRPEKALKDGYRMAPGDSDDHEMNSFPSGHTAGVLAVSRALSRELDGAAAPAALVTGAVAAIQPVAGHHYISDVLAGAAIGWAAEAIVDAVFERVLPAEQPSGGREGDRTVDAVGGDQADV